MSAPRAAATRTASVALVIAGLALAGCSSKSPGTTTSTAPDPVASSLGPGAATDLTKKSCTADAAGAWGFTGTVTNPTDKKSRYTFTISVVKTVGSTVVASKEVTKDVAGKATAPLSFPKVMKTKGSKGLSCVVSTRAKRG